MGIAASVIGGTFCMDSSGFEEYRYQPTRTSKAIYSIGDSYFSVGKKKPKDVVGNEWKMHKDQTFASLKNTVLWVSEAVNEGIENVPSTGFN